MKWHSLYNLFVVFHIRWNHDFMISWKNMKQFFFTLFFCSQLQKLEQHQVRSTEKSSRWVIMLFYYNEVTCVAGGIVVPRVLSWRRNRHGKQEANPIFKRLQPLLFFPWDRQERALCVTGGHLGCNECQIYWMGGAWFGRSHPSLHCYSPRRRPLGILETKMAASTGKHSILSILRKNRGLWTV